MKKSMISNAANLLRWQWQNKHHILFSVGENVLSMNPIILPSLPWGFFLYKILPGCIFYFTCSGWIFETEKITMSPNYMCWYSWRKCIILHLCWALNQGMYFNLEVFPEISMAKYSSHKAILVYIPLKNLEFA